MHPPLIDDADLAGQDRPLAPWWQSAWPRLKARLATSWRPRRAYLCGAAHVLNDAQACSQAVRAFGQWCAQHEGSVCELGLSSHWLLTSLSAGDVAPEAAIEQALSHWAHYFDLDTQDVQARWVLRHTLQPELGLVCAVPLPLIEGLREQAALHGVQLLGVSPWWVQGLQQVLGKLGQREGIPAPSHLRLSEPGLLTHIETMPRGGGLAVSRLWMEALDAAQAGASASPLLACVRAPQTHAGEAAAWSAHVWDHPEAAQLLCGDETAWQVPA